MKNGIPEVVVIRNAEGKREEYDLHVMRVISKYPDGRPAEMQVVHNDQTVSLEGGECFALVYMRRLNYKNTPMQEFE